MDFSMVFPMGKPRNLMSFDPLDLRPMIEQAAKAVGKSISEWLRSSIQSALDSQEETNELATTLQPVDDHQEVIDLKSNIISVRLTNREKERMVSYAKKNRLSLSAVIGRLVATDGCFLITPAIESALRESNVILAGFLRNYNQLVRQINSLAKSNRLTEADILNRMNGAYIERIIDSINIHMDYQRTTFKI